MQSKPLVLIVEDDATLRFLARKQLAIVGLECHLACNGIQAVNMARQNYDLIFMDLSMPEMNGLDASVQIRQDELNEGRSRTPIIALTAFSERDKCTAAGMDGFIQKPLLLDQLRAVLKTFLNYGTNGDSSA